MFLVKEFQFSVAGAHSVWLMDRWTETLDYRTEGWPTKIWQTSVHMRWRKSMGMKLSRPGARADKAAGVVLPRIREIFCVAAG
jgi:hypothetical protein